jgi:outer membrane lipoprotein SlyB
LQHRKRDISSFAEPNPFFVVNVYPNEQAGIVFAILANMAPGSLERVNSNLAMEEDMFKGSVILMIVAPCLALTGCQSANMYSGTATPGCVAGTVGGAVVGGLAGATIGSGTGQLWAVGGGATLGGAAGSALTCR